MLAYLKKEFTVSPSLCDHNGRLSYPGVFDVFMDMAAEHADKLGIGFNMLSPRHLFWLTAKTRVHFFDRPSLMSKMLVETWPEVPGRLRCNRDYRITQDGNTLAVGKTEWAVFDMMNNKVCQSKEVYPDNLEHFSETVLDSGFERVKDTFTEDDFYAEYTINSTDIDIGKHMNNVAYIKALYSTFTCSEIDSFSYNDIEVIYRNQSFEGETLKFYKQLNEDSAVFKISKADGTVSVIIRMTNCEE